MADTTENLSALKALPNAIIHQSISFIIFKCTWTTKFKNYVAISFILYIMFKKAPSLPSMPLALLLARWTSITQNATSCNGLKQDIERGNSRALPSTCSGSSGPSTWAPSQAHGRLAITRNCIISKVNHQSRQHVPQYDRGTRLPDLVGRRGGRGRCTCGEAPARD